METYEDINALLEKEHRVEVMKNSLVLEFFINKLLYKLLNLESEQLKALGNSSSAISFKSKLYLLQDINILSNQEVELVNTAMEVRNKFLHVLEVDTYEKAVNDDLKRKLLKHCNLDADKPLEDRLLNGYLGVINKCTNIFSDKVALIEDRDSKKDFHLQLLSKLPQHITTHYRDLIDALRSKLLSLIKENKENLEICSQIGQVIVDCQNTFAKDELTKQMSAHIGSEEYQEVLLDLTKINKGFKY